MSVSVTSCDMQQPAKIYRKQLLKTMQTHHKASQNIRFIVSMEPVILYQNICPLGVTHHFIYIKWLPGPPPPVFHSHETAACPASGWMCERTSSRSCRSWVYGPSVYFLPLELVWFCIWKSHIWNIHEYSQLIVQNPWFEPVLLDLSISFFSIFWLSCSFNPRPRALGIRCLAKSFGILWSATSEPAKLMAWREPGGLPECCCIG